MIRLRKKKPVFSVDQSDKIVEAIRQAEKQTSGEIRLFVEGRCKYVDALDRARQVFGDLEMEQTKLRNGVLFYLAIHDRQIAIFADEGISKVVQPDFWWETLCRVIAKIKSREMVQGLCEGILEVGEVLSRNFPNQPGIDKNELPDEIVFGD
ncbi:MAG: TPM domain-containing protein [Chitinophagaceae bacterium]|nr:TPM domain-containing protein [Chitinophagaceae bacterium]